MKNHAKKRFLAIGECMVELSGGAGGMFKMGFAGDTLNTAWYARLALGDDWDVSYFTAVGDDIYSVAMREFFNKNNILTDSTRTIPHKRAGLYVIHQEGGDRQFTYWRETSAARHLADDVQALISALDEAECIYFSGITLAILAPARRTDLLNAIGRAHQKGVTIAFDPNIRASLWPDKNELIQSLNDAASVSTIVLPTLCDETALFENHSQEQMNARYVAAGAREVVSKNGADPVCVFTDGTTKFIAVEAVGGVVDATGAGDSFNGAYLAARLQGETSESAACVGIKMAAKVICHQGALIPQ